jgi:hypothetical protein
MVGLMIRNEIKQQDKRFGFSFRQKDQISGEVIRNVFEKVPQSNSRFNALDKLVIKVLSVKMPVGFGGVKSKGGPLLVLAHLKRSIVEVKAEKNCLAQSIIIAESKLRKIRIMTLIVEDAIFSP